MTRVLNIVVSSLCVLLWWTGLSSAADTPAAKPAEVPNRSGRVAEVTLYRGQALVTRIVPLAGGKGGVELVVGPLPEQIVPNSLFAEGGDGVEVRAVRFRSRAVGDEPREEVRKLDGAIEELAEQLQSIQREQQVLAKRNAYLDQMESFVIPTMKTDLARGFLDAAALERLTQLSFSQREAAAKKTGELEKAAKQLHKQSSLLQRKRAELTGGAQKAVREALLFVEKRGDAKGDVRLSYLVNNCHWSPTYTFRAGKDRKEVAVECDAIITQMTGEDWSDAKLTLSTASPGLSAAGPGLAPLPISLAPSAAAGKVREAAEIAARARNIQGRQAAAVDQRRNVVGFEDAISSSWALNVAAGDYQTLELAVGKELLRAGKAEGPSLSYQIAHPVSLPSRRDQQMVRIMQTSFKGVFYHVATPVLSSYVYREAELENRGDDDLLAGPITVYLDGRFVGRSEIPTVARGQTFVVGLGADPQLRTRRELVERSELVQGGNRELSFKYRLVLENFKQEAAAVRLLDRAPYSDKPAEVRIKLGEMKDPLSTDPLYVRTEKPKNILRWDLSVPPGATAEKAKLVEYGFTVEFDRNLTLGLPEVSVSDDKDERPAEQAAAERSSEAMGGPYPASSLSKPAAPNASFRQFEELQRAKAAR